MLSRISPSAIESNLQRARRVIKKLSPEVEEAIRNGSLNVTEDGHFSRNFSGLEKFLIKITESFFLPVQKRMFKHKKHLFGPKENLFIEKENLFDDRVAKVYGFSQLQEFIQEKLPWFSDISRSYRIESEGAAKFKFKFLGKNSVEETGFDRACRDMLYLDDSYDIKSKLHKFLKGQIASLTTINNLKNYFNQNGQGVKKTLLSAYGDYVKNKNSKAALNEQLAKLSEDPGFRKCFSKRVKTFSCDQEQHNPLIEELRNFVNYEKIEAKQPPYLDDEAKKDVTFRKYMNHKIRKFAENTTMDFYSEEYFRQLMDEVGESIPTGIIKPGDVPKTPVSPKDIKLTDEEENKILEVTSLKHYISKQELMEMFEPCCLGHLRGILKQSKRLFDDSNVIDLRRVIEKKQGMKTPRPLDDKELSQEVAAEIIDRLKQNAARQDFGLSVATDAEIAAGRDRTGAKMLEHSIALRIYKVLFGEPLANSKEAELLQMVDDNVYGNFKKYRDEMHRRNKQ